MQLIYLIEVRCPCFMMKFSFQTNIQCNLIRRILYKIQRNQFAKVNDLIEMRAELLTSSIGMLIFSQKNLQCENYCKKFQFRMTLPR